MTDKTEEKNKEEAGVIDTLIDIGEAMVETVIETDPGAILDTALEVGGKAVEVAGEVAVGAAEVAGEAAEVAGEVAGAVIGGLGDAL